VSTQQLRALLAYRMAQADETLQEAQILRNAGTLRGAVNRAYYAMFYAALALLATRRLGTSRHSGVLALFDREFVKTKLLPRDLSRSFHLAFDQRQVHDYGELATLDGPTVDQTIVDAEQFVAAARGFLRGAGYL
jgi:uncharacterized protein (UPF0332 family)